VNPLSHVDAAVPADDGRSWRAAVADLLQRTRLVQPDGLSAAAAAAAAPVGLDVWMYLVDQEQRMLRPVPRPAAEPSSERGRDAVILHRLCPTRTASAGSARPCQRPKELLRP
jgi:hypothetical protein